MPRKSQGDQQHRLPPREIRRGEEGCQFSPPSLRLFNISYHLRRVKSSSLLRPSADNGDQWLLWEAEVEIIERKVFHPERCQLSRYNSRSSATRLIPKRGVAEVSSQSTPLNFMPRLRLAVVVIPRSHAMHVYTLHPRPTAARLCEFGLPSRCGKLFPRKLGRRPHEEEKGRKRGREKERGRGEGRS